MLAECTIVFAVTAASMVDEHTEMVSTDSASKNMDAEKDTVLTKDALFNGGETKAAAGDGSGGKGLLPFLRRLCVAGPVGRLLTKCAVPQSRLQCTQPRRRRLQLATAVEAKVYCSSAQKWAMAASGNARTLR